MFRCKASKPKAGAPGPEIRPVARARQDPNRVRGQKTGQNTGRGKWLDDRPDKQAGQIR